MGLIKVHTWWGYIFLRFLWDVKHNKALYLRGMRSNSTSSVGQLFWTNVSLWIFMTENYKHLKTMEEQQVSLQSLDPRLQW